jgi:DNA-binding NtrC family response regulator
VRRFTRDGADLIVACLPVPGSNGLELLESLRCADRSVPIVVCGSDAALDGAAQAYEHGAFEYVQDPVKDIHDLLSAVGVALGSRRGDAQFRYLMEKDADQARWDAFIGTSPSMQEVYRVVRLLCDRSSRGGAPTVLITGETGTGKGMLAKCIHYNGGRRTKAFVEVNCASIPGNLLESELFGHERGAFTDAHASRAGLFETADRGTLFLDEIGSVPMPLQAKLLTAIEEKRIRRLGARQSKVVDVQIVAATHVDLKKAVRDHAFRADLYHRLNVVVVRMPALRERGNDRLLLAESFLARTCAEYGLHPRSFSKAARRHLLEYHWPGNVRELKNQIERIVLLHNDEEIDVEHFEAGRSSLPPEPNDFLVSLPEDGVALDDIEREAIRRALQRTSGNVSRAARFLRVTRQTLIYRMRKHGLEATSA